MARVRLEDERRVLQRVLTDGVTLRGPHDHLKHRRTPVVHAERSRQRLLQAWSVLTTPLILLTLGWLFYPEASERGTVVVLAIAGILSVEAFSRGYFGALIIRLLLLLLIVRFVEAYAQNWQWGTLTLLAAMALVVLVVNIRDAVRR